MTEEEAGVEQVIVRVGRDSRPFPAKEMQFNMKIGHTHGGFATVFVDGSGGGGAGAAE